MSSIDDVKRRLSIDELDTDTRNSLFNKFVDGGGEVIKEKHTRQSVSFNRDKQKEFHQTITEHKKRLLEKDKANSRKQGGADGTKTQTPKQHRSLRVFWRGVFQKYFTLSSEFNKKFIRCMKNDFPEIMTSLSYATGEIVSMNMDDRIGVIDALNKENPYSYEMIMRVYDLYKSSYLEKIQNYFVKYRSIICPTILESIQAIYRDLVILYPYQNSVRDTLIKAMDYNKSITKKEPVIQFGKLNKYIDTLFNYILPGFHITLVYNLGLHFKFENDLMRKMAHITDQDDLGSMYKIIQNEKKQFFEEKEKEKEEKKKSLEEDIEKREKEKIPKFTQKGLAIIDSILDKKAKYIKQNPKLKLYKSNEKMLYLCILLDEFDKEYSFILTTNQLKLNISMQNGLRNDVKGEFEEENIKYNELNSLVKEYYQLTEESEELNKTLANSRIVLNQKQTAIEIKKAQLLNEVKSKATVFTKKLCMSLQKLITDYNGERLLLQNGDDKLNFQIELGDIRKFEKVKIINAIAATFSFASGIEYYINYDKLSTRSLYMEEDKDDKEEPESAEEK